MTDSDRRGGPIRRGRPEDRRSLARLQSALAEPNPELLAHGLAAGGVLVSTVGADAGARSDASPRTASHASDAPAGYLLAVRGGDDAHVAELVVEPKYRRQGRATALLATLAATCPGRVTLAVSPDNEAALSLYRSRGFEVVARREGYFESGPALVLELARSDP